MCILLCQETTRSGKIRPELTKFCIILVDCKIIQFQLKPSCPGEEEEEKHLSHLLIANQRIKNSFHQSIPLLLVLLLLLHPNTTSSNILGSNTTSHMYSHQIPIYNFIYTYMYKEDTTSYIYIHMQSADPITTSYAYTCTSKCAPFIIH